MTDSHIYDGWHDSTDRPCACHGIIQPRVLRPDVCAEVGHHYSYPLTESATCSRCDLLRGAPSPVVVGPTRPYEFEWLTARSGYVPLVDAKGITARRMGRVLGMVVFDGLTSTLAQVHVALDTPRAAPHLLRPTFEYAFHQLVLRVLVSVLDASNTRAVNLARGLGFREACRIRDGAAVGVDLILFELRREDCRYLNEAH